MKTEDGPAPSNAFLQVMQTHDGGEVCNELADATHLLLRDAARSVMDTVREKVQAPLLIGG